MKIKVGDTVKFLNDTGSGIVTRIVDQKTALVQVDGGFEVPWLINDLVVASGSYDGGNSSEIEHAPEPEQKKAFTENIEPENQADEIIEDEEVVLAFVQDSNSSEFETYLINSSSYNFNYVIARQQEGELVLFSQGNIEPALKINLGTYRPGNLNEDEYFRIQGLFFNAGFYHHLSPLDVLLKISSANLYDAGSRKENDYFHEKAILFTLYSWKTKPEEPAVNFSPEELKRALLTKGDIKAVKQKPVNKPTEEVDLHIENITDDFRSMDNGEILEIQISRFRNALESAILHKSGRIVFIHGVGNGKLKLEIRRIIDREYSNVQYQDASFKEYGYGATMAIIK